MDCTYLKGNKGIAYSPIYSETLYCDHSVIEFLHQLSDEETRKDAADQFLLYHPEYAEEIIENLLKIRIIQRVE